MDSPEPETVAGDKCVAEAGNVAAPSLSDGTFLVQTSRGIKAHTVAPGERSTFRQLLFDSLSEMENFGERPRRFAYRSPADFYGAMPSFTQVHGRIDGRRDRDRMPFSPRWR